MVGELCFNFFFFFDEGEVSCHGNCFWIVLDSLPIRKLWTISIFKNVASWKGEKMVLLANPFPEKILSLQAPFNVAPVEKLQKWVSTLSLSLLIIHSNRAPSVFWALSWPLPGEGDSISWFLYLHWGHNVACCQCPKGWGQLQKAHCAHSTVKGGNWRR